MQNGASTHWKCCYNDIVLKSHPQKLTCYDNGKRVLTIYDVAKTAARYQNVLNTHMNDSRRVNMANMYVCNVKASIIEIGVSICTCVLTAISRVPTYIMDMERFGIMTLCYFGIKTLGPFLASPKVMVTYITQKRSANIDVHTLRTYICLPHLPFVKCSSRHLLCM